MANANNLHSASSVPTYDIAIARVDEEIVRQKSVLFNLCTQRNSLSFTCRLPIEILEAIFIHCARDYHENGPDFPYRVPRWVNVSHICRRWRDISLNCPTLWTYVSTQLSRRWTKELLARSKEALLKIRVCSWIVDVSRFLKSVEEAMNCVERIQELHLELPEGHAHAILSKLSSRAPRLKNLKILGEDTSLEWSPVLFHVDTPALRTLEPSCCPVAWYSFKLGGLTTFSLDDVPVRFQKSMEEFLATLGSMQNLIHLYLDNALASAAGFLSSAAFHTFQKINLPHLSRLMIVAPSLTVITFLSCVNIPLTTEVKLDCRVEHDSFLDHHALLSSLLAQRFSTFKDQPLSSPTIRSLVINLSLRGAGFTFSAASERDRDPFVSISDLNWYWGCNIPLQIVVGLGRLTVEDEDRIMSNICCSIPLTNVQSVHVVYPIFSSSFWRKTLGHLQDLRYLKLSRGYMPDLSVLSLADPTTHEGVENQAEHSPSDRDRDPILAPGLEELELSRITFSPAGGDSSLPGSAITYDCLVDALSTRHGRQGRLTITRCKIDESDRFDSVLSWGDGNIM